MTSNLTVQILMDYDGEWVARILSDNDTTKHISGRSATPAGALRELITALVMVIESQQDDIQNFERAYGYEYDDLAAVGMAGIRYVETYETTKQDDEIRMVVGQQLWDAVRRAKGGKLK